ncbi:MAG: SoxR reducing system RseC family protein [Bacteroidetes bacterium]|nr:SoxR reducing system RseC family protein [Bacteroidota bacterium]
MKKNIVAHPGIIKRIEDNKVEIAIMVTSGCASCEIKGACSVSDVEEKSVMVTVDDANRYSINQPITIEMQQSLGTWAVLLGYVFPFLVLFTGLIIFINIGIDQGIAGLLSLLLLLPYYLSLYFLKNYLGTRFYYNIRP